MRRMFLLCIIVFYPVLAFTSECGEDAKQLYLQLEKDSYINIRGYWVQSVEGFQDLGKNCGTKGKIANSQQWCAITWEANNMWKTIVCNPLLMVPVKN